MQELNVGSVHFPLSPGNGLRREPSLSPFIEKLSYSLAGIIRQHGIAIVKDENLPTISS